MTPARKGSLPLLALCAVLAGGCRESTRDKGPMRLTPVEAFTDRGSAAKLTDRDTTTAVAVDAPTKLYLRFARPVAVSEVKVHGARSLSVSAPVLERFGPETEGGWASAPMSGVSITTLVLQLEPREPGASLGEVEVWGDGERRGDADPSVLARRAALPPGLAVGAADARTRWLGDDVLVLGAAIDAATLRPRGTAEGEDCVRLRFEGGAAVRSARRAYLVFEANLHRAFELQRSVASGAPSAALWLGTAREARTLVDEIDPGSLGGSDDVLLCLPIEATDSVTIDRARLVLVLDSGANGFDRDTRLLLGAAVDGDAATSAALSSGRVELGLDRIVAIDRASIRLASGSALLDSVGTFDGFAWSEQGNVTLSEGITSLDLGARRARSLALAFQGEAPSVAEIEVGGSGIGPRVGAARLVVTHPVLSAKSGQLMGERFGSDAFLGGWAESPAGPGSVEIDGAPVGVGGAFGVALRRPALEGSWAVTVRARFPDGSEVVKVIHLDDDRSAEIAASPDEALSASENSRFGVENQTAWGVLTARGGKVKLGSDVEIEAGEGAVPGDVRIGISRKGPEAMPKLDAGMVNVTAPAHFAYRFHPAGQRFAKAVKLKLPYDPDLLPEGMLPEEIQTYYYDEVERRWLTLPRVAVRRDERSIVSETTHFTFMLNAVLVLPEHPGPVSFDPTSIKDLKAADPSAGIDLIEPPAGNGQGTANVSLRIRLPKARGAYQPSLAIAYDSGGANGWLGVGWDVQVSSVSIDTRYGAPLYDGEERYLLDGAQLVPVAGGGPCTDGKVGRRYMARVEREFPQIVRCGEDTTRYWFEVTDKAGTLYVYGREPAARLTSYLPHLYAIPRFPPAYDIGQWFLERVVDSNGNLTRFAYQLDHRDGLEDRRHAEDFRQMYLSDVWYSGRAARKDGTWRSDGPYHVQLAHLPGDRTDLVASGRLGFKVVTRKRLGSIRVELGGERIREYALRYEAGDFGKSLLESVSVLSADGTPFYRHDMEYTRKADVQANGRVAAFAPAIAWDEPDGDDDHAMTSSKDKGWGGHTFVGISIFQPKNSGTVGFALDFNERTSKTDASFLDVNGDGLPDRMFRSSGAWLNRPAAPEATPALTSLPRARDPLLPAQGPAFALRGDQSLGSEKSSVFSGAVQIMGFGASGNFGGSWTTTRSRDLVLDANGDGLPDLVSDGQVWFNQPGCSGLSQADACFQRGLPAPVLQNPEIPVALQPDGPGAATGPASDARKDSFAPQDVLLEWTAPFQGIVDVSGSLVFADEVLREGRHDGVRLEIFHASPPWVHWVDGPLGISLPFPQPGAWAQVGSDVTKFPDDLTVTDVAHQVSVAQGDTLYFVLSTLSDFPVGTRSDGVTRYSAEQVGFAPVVAYFFTGDGEFVDEQRRADVDATGAPLHVYDSAADFRLAGNQQLTVTVPRAGDLRISSTLHKFPASDDLVVCARYFAPGTYDHADTACRPDDPAGTPIYLELPSDESSTRAPSLAKHVEAGSTFVFWVKSRLPIDPAAIDWQIDGELTCVDEGGSCRPVAHDDPLRAALAFRATPNVPLHIPVAPTNTEWSAYLPDARTPVPFVPPADGTLTFTVGAMLPWNNDWLRPVRDYYTWLYTSYPVTFAVRSPDALHASWTLPALSSQSPTAFTATRTVRVKRGVPVFFEGHGEVPYPVAFGVTGVVFDEDDPPPPGGPVDPVAVTGPGAPVAMVTSCGELVRRKLGNAPILGGGFHGWRYGAWQGTSEDPFLPWVYRSPREDEIPNLGDEDNEEILKAFYRAVLPPIMRDRDERERKRARLLGLLAPSADGTRRGAEPGLRPGVAAWVSQDANAFLLAGGMNAARRGARVSGANADRTITANVGFAAAGRSSVGTTRTGGIAVGPFSLAISSGMSHQDEDLIDLNGDRIPDAIASTGVPDVSALDPSGLGSFLAGRGAALARITDPAELTPRNLVSIPVQPRLNVDVGGQAGLGLTEAVKLLTSKARVTSVGGRMPDFNAGIGIGMNVSTTVEDLVDVNGDGLPDAVRRNAGCGGFSVRLNLGTSFARGEDCLQTHGWGVNVLTGLAGTLDPTGATNPDGGGDTENAVGVASGMLGRSRDPLAIRQVSTVTLQGSIGGGAVDGTESYGASVSSESSLSSTNVVLADVTGDGLPDFVAKGNSSTDFLVSVNLGYGFSPPQRWSAPAWPAGWKPNFQSGLGSLATAESLLTGFWSRASDGIDPVEATGTHSDLPSTGFVFTISFPIAPPLPAPWMQLSFGANATLGRTTGFELGLQDIDGDGFPDHVMKRRNHEPFAARVNQLGGGNLLRRVTRPLGGSFDVEYARVGNTVEMPESRWALAKVNVHDGVGTGTGHDLETRYEYAGGVYHRNEREFLGFRTVTQRNADESKVVRTFRTDGFPYKGLLESEVILDAQDRKYVETHNEWTAEVRALAVDPCVKRTPINLRYSLDLYCASTFVKLGWTEKRFFEGGSQALVRSRQSFEEYDAHGNVTRFHDWGDVADPEDDVYARVAYGPAEGKDLHCEAAPTEITVSDRADAAGDPLQRRVASYDARCNLTQLRSLVATGVEAVTDLEWYPQTHVWAGNLLRVKSAPNHKGERYEVEYEYDGDVATYVAKTTDVHGYVSEARYDPALGENVWTKDVNGQETWRAFDRFGRLWRVAAPGYSLVAPTIEISYTPSADAPRALTKNRLPGGGTLDTVVVMDGVGRVIQTKKTAEVWTGAGEATKVGWAVTGHQRFDVMGRVEEQGQTFYDGASGAAYVRGELRNATRFVYDVLARTVQVVEPNGAVTRFLFGFGTPQGTPAPRMKSTATDPLGKVRVAYKDAFDRTVAVEEHIDGRTPTTHYAYDRLGRLVTVTDAAGNATRVEYDKLGRRTKIDNPDAGVATFGFDLAGNLVSRRDAKNVVTTYVYDFERLKEIRYPTARRNVVYEYGPPGAPANGAARITRVDDEVGEETRGYDRLGNLARSTRTVDPLRPGDRTRSFTTTFDFDVFGRMLSMVYPDGEVLKYRYDAGGLLENAVGKRPATKHDPAQLETYLAALRYDEFGQRRYQRVGNGVVTKYAYEPLTRRLSWLHAQKPGERLLQNLTYSYDLAGNVLGVKNTLGEADPPNAGTVEFSYRYDDLHRLVWAHGEAKARPKTIDTFTSTFAYSDIHNMTSNVQVHRILHGGGPGELPPHTNHDLAYQYTGSGPHRATRIGDTSLVYDENGNTSRECRDPADPTCRAKPAHLRRYEWTEENRLDAVIDGGGKNVTKFLYDADGQRIAKLGRGGESITIGQFWALKGRRAATKHVFAGTTRIASKLLPPPGWDDVPRGTGTAEVVTVSSVESGCVPSNYQPQKCQVLPGGEPVLNDYYANTKVRPETYFYHPDHLGSTSWVTDQNARPHEHVEYFPYGAVWRDPRSDLGASPQKGQRFLFTGKELDEETGLYYFGARYYDPRTSLWKSADPALGSYLDGDRGLGGIRVPKNVSLYSYAHHNPVRLVDPEGESATVVGALVGAAVGAGIALWRGEDARHVLGAAVQGAIAGAIVGSVIDSGGATLGVMAMAGAGGNVLGGLAGRAIAGDEITAGGIALDAAVGAGGAVLGAAAGKVATVGIQKILGPSRAFSTLRPGPFARNPIRATGPRVTAAQSRHVTRVGQCHSCGTTSPGRASGVFTGDHQPATGLIAREAEQLLFSQCVGCQGIQATEVVMQNVIWRGQQALGQAAGAAATMSAGDQAADPLMSGP